MFNDSCLGEVAQALFKGMMKSCLLKDAMTHECTKSTFSARPTLFKKNWVTSGRSWCAPSYFANTQEASGCSQKMHLVKLRRDSCADDAGDCAESRQHAKNADSQHHRRGAISGHGSCGCHENCRHSSTGRNLKWCSSQLRLWAGRAKECHTANCHECNKCNAQRNQLGWAGHGWAFCNIDSQNATHTWTTNSAQKWHNVQSVKSVHSLEIEGNQVLQ